MEKLKAVKSNHVYHLVGEESGDDFATFWNIPSPDWVCKERIDDIVSMCNAHDSLAVKAELFNELIGHLTVLDDAGLMVFHGGYKEKQSLFLVKDILSKAKGL